jgi:hypothetical protein
MEQKEADKLHNNSTVQEYERSIQVHNQAIKSGVFRGYVRFGIDTYDIEKVPQLQFKSIEQIIQTYPNHTIYSVFSNPSIFFMLDFDDEYNMKKALDIINQYKLKCVIEKTTRGIHVFFKKHPNENPKQSNKTKVALVCGLLADIKGYSNSCSKSYTKEDNQLRKIDFVNCSSWAEVQQVPSIFLPVFNSEIQVKAKSKEYCEMLNMFTGDGRQDHVFKVIKNPLLKTLKLYGEINEPYTFEQIEKIVQVINKHIFAEPLPLKEWHNIFTTEAINESLDFSFNRANGTSVPQQQIILEILEEKYSIKFDTFTNSVFIDNERITDKLVNKIRHEDFIHLKNVKEHLYNAIDYLADLNKFDSMQELLNRLPHWDGNDRISNFWHDYINAEDNEYTRLLSKYFWATLIKRNYNLTPTKADTSVIIISEQHGLGKSLFCERLALKPELSSRLNLAQELREKSKQMQGKSIVEIPEMNGFKKRDSEDLKAFMTTVIDEYRDLHDKYITRVVRRSVLIGTTNETNIFVDTENRRYAPVVITEHINIDKLEKDKEQLYSQAMKQLLQLSDNDMRALSDELNAMLRTINKDHMATIDYMEQLQQWIEKETIIQDEVLYFGGYSETWRNKEYTKEQEVITPLYLSQNALSIQTPNKMVINSIVKAMKVLNYEYKQKRVNGERKRVFIKK